MSSLRSRLGRAWVQLRLRLRAGGWLSRRVYYLVVSNAFGRERELAAAGHREYVRRYGEGSLEFLLRRNIHMIEKGLTMRPRRASFASEYIAETVTLFESLTGPKAGFVSDEVLAWAREVLSRYLEATAQSSDPVVQNARHRLIEVRVDESRDAISGPHAPKVDKPPVDIEDLLALAERRKSVRWFLDKTVDRELVDRAMSVAAESPSACNRQPFHFRVFDDPEKVQKVAAIPMGTAGYAQGLPGVVVIVGDLSAFSDERDRHLIYTDGCLAAMAFILGLEAQGVASVCINWPDIAERDARMSKLLHLRDFERVVMLIGYGYADATGDTPYSAKRGLNALRRFNEL